MNHKELLTEATIKALQGKLKQEESKKVEASSERLGGDPKDFISDVNDIKKALESIDPEKFGTQLAKTMIEEFIKTCEDQIDMTQARYNVKENKNLNESVDWNYYNKPEFKEVNEKYLSNEGQGDTLASQIVAVVNKLVYKWYNDGDVYDNVNSGMIGGANDLSDYANWLYEYCKPAAKILNDIKRCSTDEVYEDILKQLADTCLNMEYLATMEQPSQGDIYNCDGPFLFNFEDEYEEEEW